MTDNSGLFGPVIFSYSRAEAIADGVLVDVTETAKEAGFKWPTAVSIAVWAMIEPNERLRKRFGCDVKGRLWDVLWMAMFAIKQSRNGGQELRYKVILPQRPNDSPEHMVELKLHVGPGDDAEPVITIMLPDED